MIEKMTSMKQTLAGLLEQLRQWEARHAELREKSLALFAENEILKSVRADFQAARGRIENLEAELSGLRAQETTLKEQVEERRRREVELTREMDTLRDSLKESRILLERREADLKAQEERHAAEATASAEARGELEGRVAALDARIAALEASRAELEAREARHLEKLNRLESDNALLKSEAEEVQRMMEEVAGGFQQLDVSFDQMQGELAASRPAGEKLPTLQDLPAMGEEEIARLRGMIEERDRRVLSLEKELERARGLVPQDLRFKIDTLRRENEEILARVETTAAERDRATAEGARLRETLALRERKMADLERAAEAAEAQRAEFAQLKARLEKSGGAGSEEDAERIRQLGDRLAARDNEIALLRAHASAAESERAELETERDDLRGQLKALLGNRKLEEFATPEEAERLRAELAAARREAGGAASGGAKAQAFDAIRSLVADYAAHAGGGGDEATLDRAIETFQAIVERVERLEEGGETALPATATAGPAAAPERPAATGGAGAPVPANPTFWDGKADPAAAGKAGPTAALAAPAAPERDKLASEVDALLGDVESTYKELFGE